MAHTYWRLSITRSGSPVCAVADLKFFDSGGTQIATTGGTASASSTFGSNAASLAFDNNATTFWASNAFPSVASPQWLQYQFPSAVDVASFSITSRPSGSLQQSPGDFALQYSDDGSSWTTLYTFYGANWTSAGQVQTFSSSNAAPSPIAIAWRLLITSVAGGTVAAIVEWKMYDSGGSQISTPAYAAPSSSVFVNEADGGQGAFDGNASTYWASNALPTVSSPQWLEYQFASSVDVASFSITARTAVPAQSPHDFKLQKSTDDVNWTDVGTFTAGAWTFGQTQTFMVSAAPVQQPIMMIIC